MDTLIIMLKNVIIFVLLAIPGYLMVKGKMLGLKESGAMSKLLTTVGMPALILSQSLASSIRSSAVWAIFSILLRSIVSPMGIIS